MNHAPVLDCNGGRAGLNEQFRYCAASAAFPVCPDLVITEVDRSEGELIEGAVIRISGTLPTCSNLDISGAGHTALSQIETFEGNVTSYLLLSRPIGLLASTFSDILRNVRFRANQGDPGAVCRVEFIVFDDLGSYSNTVYSTITVEPYNNPPFVDLDLGAPGPNFFTEFVEGSDPIHIVSLFNSSLQQRMVMLPQLLGEAGEAPLSN